MAQEEKGNTGRGANSALSGSNSGSPCFTSPGVPLQAVQQLNFVATLAAS